MRIQYEMNPQLSMEDEFSWSEVGEAFKDPKTYLHAVMEFSADLLLRKARSSPTQ